MEVNDELHTSIPLFRNLLGGILIGLQSPIVLRMGNLIKFVDAKPVAVSVELTKSVYDRVKRRTL